MNKLINMTGIVNRKCSKCGCNLTKKPPVFSFRMEKKNTYQNGYRCSVCDNTIIQQFRCDSDDIMYYDDEDD